MKLDRVDSGRQLLTAQLSQDKEHNWDLSNYSLPSAGGVGKMELVFAFFLAALCPSNMPTASQG